MGPLCCCAAYISSTAAGQVYGIPYTYLGLLTMWYAALLTLTRVKLHTSYLYKSLGMDTHRDTLSTPLVYPCEL